MWQIWNRKMKFQTLHLRFRKIWLNSLKKKLAPLFHLSLLNMLPFHLQWHAPRGFKSFQGSGFRNLVSANPGLKASYRSIIFSCPKYFLLLMSCVVWGYLNSWRTNEGQTILTETFTKTLQNWSQILSIPGLV